MKPAPAKPPRPRPVDPAKLALAEWLLRELRNDALLLRARIDDILAMLKTEAK